MRKRRNKKIKHAAAAGGGGGLASLFGSGEYNTYINPPHLKKVVKKTASTRLRCAPGIDPEYTGAHGGWGRLPNASVIDYDDTNPRGWVKVTRDKRRRSCRIQDETQEDN
jgi:hypothetical protein